MEIVTIALIKIHRLGTAAGTKHGSGSLAEVVRETASSEIQDLRQLIIDFAIEYGEQGSLEGLKQVPSRIPGEIAFNVEAGHVSYSTVYATCKVMTVLKAENRYFKLEEIK